MPQVGAHRLDISKHFLTILDGFSRFPIHFDRFYSNHYILIDFVFNFLFLFRQPNADMGRPRNPAHAFLFWEPSCRSILNILLQFGKICACGRKTFEQLFQTITIIQNAWNDHRIISWFWLTNDLVIISTRQNLEFRHFLIFRFYLQKWKLLVL